MKRKHEERKRYAPAFDQRGHVSDRRRKPGKSKATGGEIQMLRTCEGWKRGREGHVWDLYGEDGVRGAFHFTFWGGGRWWWPTWNMDLTWHKASLTALQSDKGFGGAMPHVSFLYQMLTWTSMASIDLLPHRHPTLLSLVCVFFFLFSAQKLPKNGYRCLIFYWTKRSLRSPLTCKFII